MAHKFSELEAKMSKESIARSNALFRKKLIEMIFSEIRRSRGMSQERLAQALNIKQPNVAKLEKRNDIYISTLRSAIEAMGGTLEIVANFSDEAIRITNFSSIGGEEVQDKENIKKRRSLDKVGAEVDHTIDTSSAG
jgi:transcriptional regulator with XRE-family HTH domain